MSDGVLIALIAAVSSAIAAVLSLIQSKRNGTALSTIHLLVNSRLTEALAEVSSLKGIIAAIVPPDRDKAQAAADVAKAADAGAAISTIVPPVVVPDAPFAIPAYREPPPPVTPAPFRRPGVP